MFDRCHVNQTEKKLRLVYKKCSLPTHLYLTAHFIPVHLVNEQDDDSFFFSLAQEVTRIKSVVKKLLKSSRSAAILCVDINHALLSIATLFKTTKNAITPRI